MNGDAVTGREIDSEFTALPFQSQLEAIRVDLKNCFWHANSMVVARSYGAFLLLQSMIDQPVYPGKILLFSPVLGKAIVNDGERIFFSRPPKADRVMLAAEEGKFAQNSITIVTGELDVGCSPELARRFAEAAKCRLQIVPEASHELPDTEIFNALQQFSTND